MHLHSPPKKPHRDLTPAEEAASALVHAVGLVLGVVGTAVLVARALPAGDGLRLASVAVFGTSLVFVYAASTAYHAARDGTLKRRLNVLDQVSIYGLIAGTYTPVALVLLGGRWGGWLFAAQWAMAALGTTLRVFFPHRLSGFSTGLYLVMGWMALLVLRPLVEALPAGAFGLILAGGVAYTVGVVFYAWNRLPFGHVVWHALVLVGSAFHFVAVLLYVVPSE